MHIALSVASILMAWIMNPKNNLFVRNPSAVEQKLAKIVQDGSSNLHVVTDFDMTLTQYWLDGKRTQTTHEVLENCSKMSNESRAILNVLYRKYSPIEVSPIIPLPEKFKAMENWWADAYNVILDLKLTPSDIVDMVQKTPVTFRPRLAEFLNLCSRKDVPVLIFSAGFADIITESISSAGLKYDNIDVVANKFKFVDGFFAGLEGPLIHTFNKNEATVTNTAHHDRIQNRQNIILMGDVLGDLRMADKMDNKVKLTIGFLNHDKDLLLDQYADAFDIVVLDDAPLDLPIMLLSSIV